MRLLICDKIHPLAIEYLQKNSIAYDYSPEIMPPALVNSIHNFEGLMVRSRTQVTKDVIEQGVNLKIIGRVGSGVDTIDVEAAAAKGIILVNAPEGNSQAVAEHTIGLMIALLRHYPRAWRSMEEGLWLKKDFGGNELSGKTVGILGYGHVGKRVEQLLKAFGAVVLIHSNQVPSLNIQDIFIKSDIVTLHVSLSTATRGLVSRELLSLMKPTAYLINTARGEVVDEAALGQALKNKAIAGAALDVFWQEPLPADSPWRTFPSVILTPHIGASTREALAKASMTVVEDLVRFANGEKLLNSVSLLAYSASNYPIT